MEGQPGVQRLLARVASQRLQPPVHNMKSVSSQWKEVKATPSDSPKVPHSQFPVHRMVDFASLTRRPDEVLN